MAMMEAPADLERLLRKAAEENGMEIIRDCPSSEHSAQLAA